MEIIKNEKAESRFVKKCICEQCKAELLVKKEDTQGYAVAAYNCPICNQYNLWLSAADKEIIKELDDTKDYVISTLDCKVSKKYQDIIKSAITLYTNLFVRKIININYYDKEA